MEPKIGDIRIYGPALSAILSTVGDSHGDGEGLLLGTVVSNDVSEINDGERRDFTETKIVVSGHLPLPGGFRLQRGSGTLDTQYLLYLLGPEGLRGVIGWYKFRRSATLQMSLRDHAVQSGLERLLLAECKCPLTTCFVFSAWRNVSGSTHTFQYAAFYGVNGRTDSGNAPPSTSHVRAVPVRVFNMGQTPRSAYRTPTGDDVRPADSHVVSQRDSLQPSPDVRTADACRAELQCASVIEEIKVLARKVVISDSGVAALRSAREPEIAFEEERSMNLRKSVEAIDLIEL